MGAEVVVVSGDSEVKLAAMLESKRLSFPVASELSIAQMQDLDLYIFHLRRETDRLFFDLGMLAVNPESKVHLIDISNTPFSWSDIIELLETVEWV